MKLNVYPSDTTNFRFIISIIGY